MMLEKFSDLFNKNRAFVWSYLNFGINAIFILAFQKLYIQKIGFENYGFFSYLLAMASFLVLLGDVSFSQSAPRWIVEGKFNLFHLQKARNAFILIALVLFAFISFIDNSPDPGMVLYLASAIFLSPWFFQISNNMASLAISNGIGKALAISFVFTLKDIDFHLLFGAAFLLPAAFTMLLLRKELSFGIDFKLLREILLLEKEIIFGRIMAFFYTSFLMILWYWLYGSDISGELSASYRLIQQMQALIPPFILIGLIKFSHGELTRPKHFLSEPFFILLITIYSVVAFLVITDPDFVSAIFFKESKVFKEMGPVLVFSPIILLISSITTNIFMINGGMRKQWLLILLGSILLSISMQLLVSYYELPKNYVGLVVLFVEIFVLLMSLICLKKA
jgi:hypothetical protein